MRKLNDQQKIDIVEKYKLGDSSIKLAKEYNVTKQNILLILKRRDVEIRNGK